MTKRIAQPVLPVSQVHTIVDSLFENDLHAARIRSLADAATGVLHAGALGIHAIGRGLAAAKGLCDKHAIKQVDRLIGNERINLQALAEPWVRHVVGQRAAIRVNMDWTDFDDDDHTMLVLSLQTEHGRSTPLLWKTHVKSHLKGNRNGHEDELLVRLRDAIPRSVKVTVVADRGFADTKLFVFLMDQLGFDFIIRLRSNTYITNADGEKRKAGEWVGVNGRMRVIHDAAVTEDECHVPLVVCVRDKAMKDDWCLAASDLTLSGQQVKKAYGKRFTCEETFRDIKDMHYGMGMSWAPIRNTERRDRMVLLAALAIVLLTFLGAAGEHCGLDRLLKSNTAKHRTMSLLRQGLRWFDLMLTMPGERLRMLMDAFAEIVQHSKVCTDALGII